MAQSVFEKILLNELNCSSEPIHVNEPDFEPLSKTNELLTYQYNYVIHTNGWNVWKSILLKTLN